MRKIKEKADRQRHRTKKGPMNNSEKKYTHTHTHKENKNQPQHKKYTTKKVGGAGVECIA